MKITKYILSFILLNTYGTSLATPPPMTSELELEAMLASVPHLALFIKTAILPTMTQNTLEWYRDGRTFIMNFDFEDNEPRIIQQGLNYCLDWPKNFNQDELSDYIKRLFLTTRLVENITTNQTILRKSVEPPEYLDEYRDIEPSLLVQSLIDDTITVFEDTQGLPTQINHRKLYVRLRNHRHKKILLAKLFKHSPNLYQLVADYNKQLDESEESEEKSLAVRTFEFFTANNNKLRGLSTNKDLWTELNTDSNRYRVEFLEELQSINQDTYTAMRKLNDKNLHEIPHIVSEIIRIFDKTEENLPKQEDHIEAYRWLYNNRCRTEFLEELQRQSQKAYDAVIARNEKSDQKISLALQISELFSRPTGSLPKSYIIAHRNLYTRLNHNRFKTTFLTELQNLNPAAYKAVLEGNIAIENSI